MAPDPGGTLRIVGCNLAILLNVHVRRCMDAYLPLDCS